MTSAWQLPECANYVRSGPADRRARYRVAGACMIATATTPLNGARKPYSSPAFLPRTLLIGTGSRMARAAIPHCTVAAVPRTADELYRSAATL